MPEAFGNIWDQYQRGHRKMYAPQAAAAPGPAPFVGQPIGASQINPPSPQLQPSTEEFWRNLFTSQPMPPSPAGHEQEMENLSRTGIPSGFYQMEQLQPKIDPTMNQRVPPLKASGGTWDPGVDPSIYQRPSDRQNQVFEPSVLQVSSGGPLTTGEAPYVGAPLGADPEFVWGEGLGGDDQFESGEGGGGSTGTSGTYPAAPTQPTGQVTGPPSGPLTTGAADYSNTIWDPDPDSQYLQAVAQHHTNQAAHHINAAAAHTAAGHAAANQVTVRRAQPVSQAAGPWTYGAPPTAQPGLGQRFLQSLGHLFRGTLGQHRLGYQYGGLVQRPQQPQSDPSELSQQDLSALSGSGGGEPQSRYQMRPFDPSLTKIGGFTGAGGTAGSGLAPAGALVGGLSGGLAKKGAGGGGSILNTSQDPDPDIPYLQAAGYDTSGMGGGGGMGGLGGAFGGAGGLGSTAAGVLQAFGDLVSKANAPVSVDPSKWANPPPGPATFTFPTLARNYGYTY